MPPVWTQDKELLYEIRLDSRVAIGTGFHAALVQLELQKPFEDDTLVRFHVLKLKVHFLLLLTTG